MISPTREVAEEALRTCEVTDEAWRKSALWRLHREWQITADAGIHEGEEEIRVSRDLIRMLSR